MATLVTHFSAVVAWVIASLTTVLNAVIDTPLLLLFVALAISMAVFAWVKSLIHF